MKNFNMFWEIWPGLERTVYFRKSSLLEW